MVWDDFGFFDFDGDGFDGHDHGYDGAGHSSGGLWNTASKWLGAIGEFIVEAPIELLADSRSERLSQKSGRKDLHVMVGTATVLLTAGAVFLYARHKQKQAIKARHEKLALMHQHMHFPLVSADATAAQVLSPAPAMAIQPALHAPAQQNVPPQPSFTQKTTMPPAGSYRSLEENRKAQPKTVDRNA